MKPMEERAKDAAQGDLLLEAMYIKASIDMMQELSQGSFPDRRRDILDRIAKREEKEERRNSER